MLVISALVTPAFATCPDDQFAADMERLVAEQEVVFVEGELSRMVWEADVIVVDYRNIHAVASEARALVDSGALLYITSPMSSRTDLAAILNIPQDSIPRYNELVLQGTYVYKMYDVYVWGNHYAMFVATSADEVEEFPGLFNSLERGNSGFDYEEPIVPGQNDMPFSNVTLLEEAIERGYLSQAFEVNDSVPRIIEARLTTEARLEQISVFEGQADPNSRQLVSLPAGSQIFTGHADVFAVGQSFRIGWVQATQYLFNRGRVSVNGTMMTVFDAVTDFAAHPNSTARVQRFTGRMHSNIVGHQMLQAADLPSGSTGNFTISMGTNLAFSYSFNPHGATISRSAPQLNIRDWTYAASVLAPFGVSRSMAPAVRVGTNNGVGQRGVFSRMTVPTNLFAGIGTINVTQFEVGGWV